MPSDKEETSKGSKRDACLANNKPLDTTRGRRAVPGMPAALAKKTSFGDSFSLTVTDGCVSVTKHPHCSLVGLNSDSSVFTSKEQEAMPKRTILTS